jgi:hypothetical protein
MKDGYPYRHWTLWDHQIVRALYARRESVRNLLHQFEIKFDSGASASGDGRLGKFRLFSVSLPAMKRSVPGGVLWADKTFDSRHAVRAWGISVRLREQSERLGLPHVLPLEQPTNGDELLTLELEMQKTVKRLANATDIVAPNLEQLVYFLEHYGFASQRCKCVASLRGHVARKIRSGACAGETCKS